MGGGFAKSVLLAAAALLVPALSLVPALVSALSGFAWSWTNPWSWAGLLVIFLPLALVCARWLGTLFRRLAGRWCGLVLQNDYRLPETAPEPVLLSTGYWWNGHSYERDRRDAELDQRWRRRMGDPAGRALVAARGRPGLPRRQPALTVAGRGTRSGGTGGSGRARRPTAPGRRRRSRFPLNTTPMGYGVAGAVRHATVSPGRNRTTAGLYRVVVEFCVRVFITLAETMLRALLSFLRDRLEKSRSDTRPRAPHGAAPVKSPVRN
ncbi:hypothetical protein DMH03_14420 [Amycolatopsis sp. WAC 01376]|nr:hypothetical protein DMH03_14420 [Amycolatopsis sp. WAC 01376]